MAKGEKIITERLIIEPFSEKYLTSRYVNWLNDKEVVRFSEQRHCVHTLETCRAYMKSFENSPNYFWALIHKDPAIGHIGNMNATVNVKNQWADIGILIGDKKVWGQGYATEAWRAVINFLFEQAGVRKVCAGTTATNVGMRHVMKKLGMVEDGVRKDHLLIDGKSVDVVHAALFRQ